MNRSDWYEDGWAGREAARRARRVKGIIFGALLIGYAIILWYC